MSAASVPPELAARGSPTPAFWFRRPARDEGRCLCGCGCNVERDFLGSSHCGLCQLRIHAERAETS